MPWIDLGISGSLSSVDRDQHLGRDKKSALPINYEPTYKLYRDHKIRTSTLLAKDLFIILCVHLMWATFYQ
ncbi:hypothetical protein HAX54_008370, partial [Datura stramonium]|nr:hypothetical protein [Datura stramonium]